MLLAAPPARAALLGVLARGGAAAALVPDLVEDGLRASPDVATAGRCGITEIYGLI